MIVVNKCYGWLAISKKLLEVVNAYSYDFNDGLPEYLIRGFIQLFTCVPMIFHTSSIHVTPMIGGIDYSHDVRVFLNGC